MEENSKKQTYSFRAEDDTVMLIQEITNEMNKQFPHPYKQGKLYSQSDVFHFALKYTFDNFIKKDE